jgi:hypothetical protein
MIVTLTPTKETVVETGDFCPVQWPTVSPP